MSQSSSPVSDELYAEVFVFRIYDAEKGMYWRSPRGKSIWSRPHDAKAAWNFACNHSGRGGFDVQSHIRLHRFRLERVIL